MINKKMWVFGAVFFFVVLVGIFYYVNTMSNGKPNLRAMSVPTSSPVAREAKSSTKEIVVSGSNFKFVPSEIAVKKGDTVRVVFKNSDGFHDFVIDEFNVKTKQIKAGSEESVEFVADKAGSFEYYCSVGQHRAMGMWGTLKVK